MLDADMEGQKAQNKLAKKMKENNFKVIKYVQPLDIKYKDTNEFYLADAEGLKRHVYLAALYAKHVAEDKGFKKSYLFIVRHPTEVLLALHYGITNVIAHNDKPDETADKIINHNRVQKVCFILDHINNSEQVAERIKEKLSAHDVECHISQAFIKTYDVPSNCKILYDLNALEPDQDHMYEMLDLMKRGHFQEDNFDANFVWEE